jgi:hypothetical protein
MSLLQGNFWRERERGHNRYGVLFGGWMDGILLASSVEV